MSRPVAVASVVLAVLSFGLGGCRAVTDLGVPCSLVRKGAPGTEELAFITNAEITAGQEYISFGATECENWVCVRDADFPEDKENPGFPAKGYCSANCIPQDGPSLTDNCPAANAADDKEGSPNKLTCRAVSVDADMLAAYKAADPEGYRRNFGESTTPFYCARGDGIRDSGT